MTCPKCGHLVNKYSGRCQNVHCSYQRGQQIEAPQRELTPALDFGPTLVPCHTCGTMAEHRVYRDQRGNTICKDCFYQWPAPQAVAA